MAVVERFKQELMHGLSAGTKKCGCCREVAVRGGSTVYMYANSTPLFKPLEEQQLMLTEKGYSII